MAWNKLDIINFAFNILNKSSVTDLINSGTFAVVASTNFDLLYETEISGGSWRFATKLASLSMLNENPILQKWRYEFQIPPDYLAMVVIYPLTPFQIFENKIYTNVKEIVAEYRFLPDPTHLPAYFVNYFSVLLAQRFALAVANDASLAQKLEEEIKDTRSQALFIDSQSHPTPRMRINPILAARSGGEYQDYVYGGWI